MHAGLDPVATAVLLVEDEPMARKWFLRTFGDEFTLLAVDGVDSALAMLRERGDDIAVLLTDYRLPGRDGLDLLRTLQRTHRHLVPLLYTAYAETGVTIAAVNEGRVFRILEKPLDGTATRQALRDALALYRRQSQERLMHAQRVMAVHDALGFLAHELNTPLATVRGYMGVLRARYQPPASGSEDQVCFYQRQPGEILEAIDAAMRRAQYCQDLVDTFVHSARAAHDGPSTAPIPASELIRSLLATYPFDGVERDWAALRVHEDFLLPGRRDLLYLVLCTLTKNALRVLRGHRRPLLYIDVGRAPLAERPPGPWVRIADNGPGIAPDLLPQLSHQPLTGRAGADGHGMGLMFCRRVMQSLGGSIDIQTEPGRGTAVSLLFPDIHEDRA